MENNPTQKYGFKIEVDQFGYKYPTQDFYDVSEIILIEKFEKISQIIKSIEKKEYCMIELGCNQCFYSIFFLSMIGREKTKLIMVEPYQPFLERGFRNLDINNIDLEIINRCVGRKKWIGHSPNYEFDVDLISIQELIEKHEIVDIFHCDIDGSEVEMLEQNKEVFFDYRFRVIFLLTHDIGKETSTHEKVKYFFNQTEYELIYECDEDIIGSDTLLIYSIDKKITELYKK